MRPTWPTAGSMATALLAALATTSALAQGHGVHPPMPNQHYNLQVRTQGSEEDEEEKTVNARVALRSASAAALLDQSVDLPAPFLPIRVTRYLPQAVLDQTVVPDTSKDAKPAIHLAIEGSTQSFRRWLIADDPARNRLISMIGTWRYMAVTDRKQRDELFQEFETEFTREPKLRISREDGSDMQELLLKEGTVQRLGSLGCTVLVRSFYPHYAMDDKTQKPTNVSDKRVNPAILVEIESGGRKELRWVFSKFPDFGQREENDAPVKIVLECPVEPTGTLPDVVVVSIGDSQNEAWIRYKGKISSSSLAPDQPIDLPGSQYRFRAVRFVSSGHLAETYVPADGRGGIPVLQVEITNAKGVPTTEWLALDRRRVFTTSAGKVTLLFGLGRGDS